MEIEMKNPHIIFNMIDTLVKEFEQEGYREKNVFKLMDAISKAMIDTHADNPLKVGEVFLALAWMLRSEYDDKTTEWK